MYGAQGMVLEPNLQKRKIDKRQKKDYANAPGGGQNLKKIVASKLDTLLNEVEIIDSKKQQPSKKRSKLPPKMKNSNKND